jgi:hypothetical protein
VEAIFNEDDLPAQWAQYYQINVDFFSQIGSPGGAARLGAVGSDPSAVAELPPQG